MLRSLINQSLGRYQIIDLLGRGGMAAVYHAHDAVLQRDIALKVLYPQYCEDQTLVARFKREAITAAALEHPNIVPIYDVGEQDGIAYIAMKLLLGASLQDVLHKRGALKLDELLNVLAPVARALDYAHAHNVVHRDIKPGNILILNLPAALEQPLQIDPNDVVLTDFGIAKVLDTPGLTTTGALLGTPEYMAPEQIGNRPLDGRADIYALGALTFRALTGRSLFTGSTQDILMAHLHKPTPAPSAINSDLPASLDAPVLRALARNPDQRYATADAFVAALHQSASTLSDSNVYAAAVAAASDPSPNSNGAPNRSTMHQAVNSPDAQRAYRRWRPWIATGIALLLVGSLATVLANNLYFDGGSNGSSSSIATQAIPAGGGGIAPMASASSTVPIASETVSPTIAASPTNVTTPTSTAAMPSATAEPPTATNEATRPGVEPSPTPVAIVSATPIATTTPAATVTASPTPTATPTPTPCAIAMRGGFAKLYDEQPSIRERLGCPISSESPAYATQQFFEGGTMFYWQPTNAIYVFFGLDAGTYRSYTPEEANNLPEPTPDPDDPRAPVRGFGRLYANVEIIREELGLWESAEIVLDSSNYGVLQRFSRGVMIFTPTYRDQGKSIFVLYDDGSFERYRDEFEDDI